MNSNERLILHIDVNSAFLSFEAVYRLQHGETVDLRDIPSAVAGSQATRHGIILAKSIPAKKYGIKTGEPTWEARQKCPQLVTVPPNYALYMFCHNSLKELLKNFSDRIQVFSVDEFFLDVTGMPGADQPLELAHIIRKRIKKKLGFTVSIGISSNKLLAKMGSELKKPDAVSTLFPPEIPGKMWPLPVEDLYMVGRATSLKLRKMGIGTIGSLANCDLELLKYKFKSWGKLLWDYANGIESSAVSSSSRDTVKGIGNSTTVHFDVEDRRTAHQVLLSLVETVGMRMRFSGLCCRVIAISIRRAEDLTFYSHQLKIQTPIDSTTAIYEYCKRLFDEAWGGEPIRHLGVRVSDLSPAVHIQLSMFEKEWEKQKVIDRAVDQIRMKFGPGSVIRSNFLWSGLAPMEGGLSDDASYPVMTSIL
ncbi:MAG: DNA polymerase Y family protein [Caldicoprobacterales bacterium]|jgi:DNA polymerase-4|nr:DNA polymerase IV [Clostridiales bacterium]